MGIDKSKYDLINCAEQLMLFNKRLLPSSEVIGAYEWVTNNYVERIKYFNQEVFNTTDIFYDKNRLISLFYILQNDLNVTKKSREEIEIEYNKLPEGLKGIHRIDEFKFIEPSYSLMCDISMYFAGYFLFKYPSLEWCMLDDSVANYGEPCLYFPSGLKLFVPFQIIGVTSLGIYRRGEGIESFVTAIEAWEKNFDKMYKLFNK